MGRSFWALKKRIYHVFDVRRQRVSGTSYRDFSRVVIRPAGWARRFPYFRGESRVGSRRAHFLTGRVGSDQDVLERRGSGPGQGRVGSEQDVLEPHGSGQVRIASGRIRIFSNLAGRAGSGSCRIGSGCFASRVEPGQVRVGLDQDGFKYCRSGRVGSGRVGSPLPGPTREKPLQITTRGTIAVTLFGI